MTQPQPLGTSGAYVMMMSMVSNLRERSRHEACTRTSDYA
jgi:hypothetical protein